MLNNRSLRISGVLAGLLLLAAALVASLRFGFQPVSLADVVNSFIDYDGGTLEHLIIRSERTVRTIIALCVGSALAVAGTLMQTLTRNALASPGLLGINAGALFLVVIGITLFSLNTPLQLIWLAFAGAALAATLVYFLGRETSGTLSPMRTILAGVAITTLFVSVSQGLLIFHQERLETLMFWIAGSVSGRDLDTVSAIPPMIGAALLLSLLLARQLNLLGLDDDVMQGLGLQVARVRILSGLLVVVLAGASVAISGLIGFVGLIVPHIARALFGTDHRWLLPASALIGAILLLVADTLARLVIPPREIPIGVITALLGTPLFLHLATRGSTST